MTSASCLYEGTIRHRRVHPAREFRYRLVLAYLDLEELPRLLGGRLVSERPGLVRFRRADYLGDPATPLDRAVRDTAEAHTGHRPEGPIRVLTQLRAFGHCFNPVSFYYCLSPSGELEALVAEVTNTPWGERQAYVIPGRQGEFTKELHVSPFLSMDQTYTCQANLPGRVLSVHIENLKEGSRVFDATLTLRRRELGVGSLGQTVIRYPMATVRVLALIYRQALALRFAGAHVFSHTGRGAL